MHPGAHGHRVQLRGTRRTRRRRPPRRRSLLELVRTFDDPATWIELHLAADGLGGEAYRTSPLDNQWELCDLTADAIEADNRWTDPGLHELCHAHAAQGGPRHVRTRAQPALALRGPPATDRGAQPDAFCRHAVRSSPVRLIPRRLRARADCPLPLVTLRVRIERSRH